VIKKGFIMGTGIAIGIGISVVVVIAVVAALLRGFWNSF
jgi:hypothetical protein